MFELGNRLAKCASFVREGAKLVDIGSDHGYLPVYLLKKEKVKTAIAADIGEKPLAYAKSNAAKYMVDVKCILSDGFENIEPSMVSDAVIAGMGGELISNIISKAEWLKENDRQLILQPMTAEYELRLWLSENAYSIIKEETTVDDGKVYTVMLVKANNNSKLNEIELYMGKIVPHSPYSDKYAQKIVKRLSRKLIGYKHNNNIEDIVKTEKLISEIEEMYL